MVNLCFYKNTRGFRFNPWKISTSLEPKIIYLDTKSELNNHEKLFLNSKAIFILLCLIISVIYMILRKYLVQLWVGDSEPNGDLMYYIASVALFFYSISGWPISFAFAQVKLKKLTKVSIIELIFKISFHFNFV